MNTPPVSFSVTPSVVPLLKTKLAAPRSAADAIVRQRLIERLNEASDRRVVRIVAPAGFGKSTLLEQWSAGSGRATAWLSLDAADNDTVRFWSYVSAAIDVVLPGFAEASADAIRLIQPGRHEMPILRLLDAFHDMTEPLALIWDDFHLISERSLLESIAFFADRLPDGVQLILSSRHEEEFELFKTDGPSLILVDRDQLRFRPDEGIDFYRVGMSLQLSSDESLTWVRRTEGWITAMKLAALSMRGGQRSSELLQRFSGSSHLMEHYLMEEVFERQSPEHRRFLLDCSILRRMNVALCEAVTEDPSSGDKLLQLQKADLFLIPLDDEGRWFRFHHLFGEFLRERLERESRDRIKALLSRAGAWSEQAGSFEEALQYYLSGERYREAVALLEEMLGKVSSMDDIWMSRQFACIPENILLEKPLLYFSYLHLVLLAEENIPAAVHMLDMAERYLTENEKNWNEKKKNDYRGIFYFLKMLYAATMRDQEMAGYYMQESKKFAPSGIKLIFARSKNSGVPSVSKEHMQQEGMVAGEFLVPFLQQMIQPMNQLGLAGPIIACLAETQYQYDELENAETNARLAFEATEPGLVGFLAELLLPAGFTLSRSLLAQHRIEEARRALEYTRRQAIELGMTHSIVYCDAEIAIMDWQAGRKQPVEDWLRLYGMSESSDPEDFDSSNLYEHQYLAKFLVWQNRDERAWALTNAMRLSAKRNKRFQQQIEIELLQCVLLERASQNGADQAADLLLRMLHDTEAHGFLRLYLDAGSVIERLLIRIGEQWTGKSEGQTPSAAYVHALLSKLGRGDLPRESADPSSPLTAKEREVLTQIVQGRTNQEIAERLNVSRGTIRAHINNIYGKLYVGTRDEAVRRGKLLGL
ncbi:LuxR C-terminal-related transcriptional regulator [Saccharibacillus sp. CPCC 101409]|uniref:LuxR C-terminal-related transcriptional regulator n=1 Tax=Saccharibacillus sp. CPCC 101409 TaxID=3058041 RepID=UPI002671FE0A|nr:LuxR C-terminal-related transcriptional regulator [Saccharibacillus sp. CPCC 101409]MDO3411279.1 LuxR C-terminal-related transcriptional regulator [Saccharibacillus sp. CPCC 101409]